MLLFGPLPSVSASCCSLAITPTTTPTTTRLPLLGDFIMRNFGASQMAKATSKDFADPVRSAAAITTLEGIILSQNQPTPGYADALLR
jgi:hypothetical protein